MPFGRARAASKADLTLSSHVAPEAATEKSGETVAKMLIESSDFSFHIQS